MIFGDGTFFDAMRRGLKTLRETGKQIADPIIELRQMANRIAPKGLGLVPTPFQPEMGPLAISMPLAQGMRKGGVVKGKKAKAKPKKTKK
jgi:hypothetical protein